jgi:hypothetical protein
MSESIRVKPPMTNDDFKEVVKFVNHVRNNKFDTDRSDTRVISPDESETDIFIEIVCENSDKEQLVHMVQTRFPGKKIDFHIL